MAHKHNRRRTRPRSRNSHSFTPSFDISDDLSTSSSVPSAPSLPFITTTITTSTSPAIRTAQTSSSVVPKHWHNRYLAWQNRDKAQKCEAAKIEAEQMRLFGGVPGDDINLCYKMMEVFEGMEWVNSME